MIEIKSETPCKEVRHAATRTNIYNGSNGRVAINMQSVPQRRNKNVQKLL